MKHLDHTSPNLSPLKHSFKNLSESPNSCGCSSHRTTSTRTASRSGSTGQVINEWIMPNIHKAIMKLIIDWINICPDDFHQSAFRREFIEFLNRVSAMGEQYRWFCEEIRYLAIINVTIYILTIYSINDVCCFFFFFLCSTLLFNFLKKKESETLTEPPSIDEQINKDYKMVNFFLNFFTNDLN